MRYILGLSMRGLWLFKTEALSILILASTKIYISIEKKQNDLLGVVVGGRAEIENNYITVSHTTRLTTLICLLQKQTFDLSARKLKTNEKVMRVAQLQGRFFSFLFFSDVAFSFSFVTIQTAIELKYTEVSA